MCTAPLVWGNMLELIYSGNSKTAFALLDRFWPEASCAVNIDCGPAGENGGTTREKFISMFLYRLELSNYIEQVKELNKNDLRIQKLRHRQPDKDEL
jgi:hypothetical protein